MTTMTIHVDDVFAKALRAYAKSIGTSVNKAVREMLAPQLGLAEDAISEADNPCMKFCGILENGEAARRNKAIAAQRTIDKEMWE